MEITFWSSRIETKECVKDPFGCQMNEYDKYFEADLQLNNVDVSDWNDVWTEEAGTTVELRFAFNQYQNVDSDCFDINKFTYKWNREEITTGDWDCEDGYAQEGPG